MNIFNYLMNKKGHEIFNNDDILSYLLKKGRVHTASGTEINIKNATGFNSLELYKLSTQDGTPTPSNPVAVNTVKGYRNLFDISTADYTRNCTLDNNIYTTGTLIYGNRNAIFGYTSNNQYTVDIGETLYISLEARLISGTASDLSSLKLDDSFTFTKLINPSFTNEFQRYVFSITNDTSAAITKGRILFQPSNTSLDNAVFEIKNIMISKVNETYVPYGTNWVYTTISDGTNTKQIPLPLNDNEIAGIGDYKDELVIDKNGHATLTKKIKKWNLSDTSNNSWYLSGTHTIKATANNIGTSDSIVYDTSTIPAIYCNYFSPKSASSLYQGTELVGISIDNSKSMYFSNNDWSLNDFLTFKNNNSVIVYYVLAEPTTIDLGTIDMELYDGTNNITNSENMDMILKYYK